MNIATILQGIDDLLYGLAALVVQIPRTFFAVLVHPIRYADVVRVRPPTPAESYVAPGALLGAVLGVVALSAPLMEAALTSIDPSVKPEAGLHPLFGAESKLSAEMHLGSLVLAYGGAILGSTLVFQRWVPGSGARSLSRPVFSAHCAYWAVCLFFLWLAQLVELLRGWRAVRVHAAGRYVPGSEFQLIVGGAACLWLVGVFYQVLRHQQALPRGRAVSAAVLSFLAGIIVNAVTTAVVAPAGMVKLLSGVLGSASRALQ